MILFFLLLLAPTADAQTSYVAPTKVLSAKGYQLGVNVDSFTTSKFIDENGKAQSLASGSSFNRTQSEVTGYYGATNDLQFGLGFRFRQNRATSENASGQSIDAVSNGLESTFFNIKFAFQQVGQIQYTAEGTFRYTPYTNDEYVAGVNDPKVLILGDGGNEITAGIGMTYLAKNNNYFTVRGGYRRPGTDLSHEAYWQAEGALVWRYVALIAGVDGNSSLKNDPYDGAPEERPKYNAGTHLYNSSNREWIAPYAGVNIGLGQTWRVELRGSQVVAGHSTDLGTAFGINLIRRVDKSATRLVDSKFKTYDLEASVTKVSPKKEFLVIDKGIADDIKKGMRMDFFEFDYIGGNVLVATGVVVKTNSDTSIVKITERFNHKKELKEGLIGRSTLK